jgi:hypothetical protein
MYISKGMNTYIFICMYSYAKTCNLLAERSPWRFLWYKYVGGRTYSDVLRIRIRGRRATTASPRSGRHACRFGTHPILRILLPNASAASMTPNVSAAAIWELRFSRTPNTSGLRSATTPSLKPLSKQVAQSLEDGAPSPVDNLPCEPAGRQVSYKYWKVRCFSLSLI